ncbi:unnamed protein product [Boreogadus saida]
MRTLLRTDNKQPDNSELLNVPSAMLSSPRLVSRLRDTAPPELQLVLADCRWPTPSKSLLRIPTYLLSCAPAGFSVPLRQLGVPEQQLLNQQLTPRRPALRRKSHTG